jgi:type I restriction enzyme M protein
LAAEEYNLNIRRFVDNAPPAEPHDVHAHLHGGIPQTEVDVLNPAFSSYPSLREKLFTGLKENYLQFVNAVSQKEDIKKLFDESSEVNTTFENYTTGLQAWWNEVLPDFEQLPENHNVFELYGKFSDSFSDALNRLPFGEENNGAVLDQYQSRGALASYWYQLKNDLKSVAASGWNAELIPDDEILQSQFPDVLKELYEKQNRKEDLEALFAEVNELEEGTWTEEDYEVWPKDMLKDHKDALKALKGERREVEKENKNLHKRIKANEKALKTRPELKAEIEALKAAAQKLENDISRLDAAIEADEQRFARHTESETELKECKKVIKQIKDRKQELVDQARLKITPEEAKELILTRWNRTLHQTLNGYLQTHSRRLLQNIENLWDKYTTTLSSVLSEREEQTRLLDSFLMELGYE